MIFRCQFKFTIYNINERHEFCGYSNFVLSHLFLIFLNLLKLTQHFFVGDEQSLVSLGNKEEA